MLMTLIVQLKVSLIVKATIAVKTSYDIKNNNSNIIYSMKNKKIHKHDRISVQHHLLMMFEVSYHKCTNVQLTFSRQWDVVQQIWQGQSPNKSSLSAFPLASHQVPL